MSRKVASRFILVLSFILILTACGGGKTDGEIADTFDINESHEVIFLNIYGSGEESYASRYYDHLRQKFPHWTITHKTRSSSISGADYAAEVVVTGEKFDVFFDPIHDATIYTSNGLEYDMTDLLKKHNVDTGRIEDSMMDWVKSASNGKIYGLPVTTNRTMMFYNKEIFDKFGVPYPTDGMTWDELIELSKRLDREDGGTKYLGFSTYTNHVIGQNQFSLPPVDPKTDKPTINTDPRWKTLFETIWVLPSQQDIYKEEMARMQREPHYNDFYKDKRLAMFLYNGNLPFSTADMETFDWDVVSLPTFKDLPGVGAQGSPTFLGISKVSENKDAAMVAIKHLLSDEVQIANSRQGLMTVLKDENVQKEFAKESKFPGKNWGAYYKDKYADVSPISIYRSAALPAYYKYARLMQRGELDINTALRQAEEEAILAIEQEKAKAAQ